MKKIRVVVTMHGGVIDSVLTDASDIELDVVFTESPKHCGDDDCVLVEGGPTDGEAIYARLSSEQPVSIAALNPVFEAAKKRESRF